MINCPSLFNKISIFEYKIKPYQCNTPLFHVESGIFHVYGGSFTWISAYFTWNLASFTWILPSHTCMGRLSRRFRHISRGIWHRTYDIPRSTAATALLAVAMWLCFGRILDIKQCCRYIWGLFECRFQVLLTKNLNFNPICCNFYHLFI